MHYTCTRDVRRLYYYSLFTFFLLLLFFFCDFGALAGSAGWEKHYYVSHDAVCKKKKTLSYAAYRTLHIVYLYTIIVYRAPTYISLVNYSSHLV